jgi:hypothetical protein
MEEPQVSLIKVVRNGLERACKEFTSRISSYGFSRSKKMLWVRSRGNAADCISFFRRGSTYGSPRTASVDLRVSFFIQSKAADQPVYFHGPISDSLRDSRGYAYHLRFNANSWSTYERCIADLVRLVSEHGLPWFDSQSPLDE